VSSMRQIAVIGMKDSRNLEFLIKILKFLRAVIAEPSSKT
jgi:hypothetical protein